MGMTKKSSIIVVMDELKNGLERSEPSTTCAFAHGLLERRCAFLISVHVVGAFYPAVVSTLQGYVMYRSGRQIPHAPFLLQEKKLFRIKVVNLRV